MSNFICETCEGTDNHDFLLKCIIVGESGVGKTSLLWRMTNQGFIVNQSPTVGIDFGSMFTKIKHVSKEDETFGTTYDDIELDQNEKKTLKEEPHKEIREEPRENEVDQKTSRGNTEDKIIKLQIWDCAGQVRFRSLVQSYFRQAQVVFFVYDVNNYESFLHLDSWINTFNDQVGENNYISCIIGNKCDLDSNIDVSEVETFCKEKNLACYFMSAKTDLYEVITKPLTNCVAQTYSRYLSGTVKLDVPYWNKETIDLKRKRKKKRNPDDETTNCLVCPLQ